MLHDKNFKVLSANMLPFLPAKAQLDTRIISDKFANEVPKYFKKLEYDFTEDPEEAESGYKFK